MCLHMQNVLYVGVCCGVCVHVTGGCIRSGVLLCALCVSQLYSVVCVGRWYAYELCVFVECVGVSMWVGYESACLHVCDVCERLCMYSMAFEQCTWSVLCVICVWMAQIQLCFHGVCIVCVHVVFVVKWDMDTRVCGVMCVLWAVCTYVCRARQMWAHTHT